MTTDFSTPETARDWIKSQLKEQLEIRLANETDPAKRRIILEFLDQELITDEGMNWLKQQIVDHYRLAGLA
jgi:hypothetical protein